MGAQLTRMGRIPPMRREIVTIDLPSHETSIHQYYQSQVLQNQHASITLTEPNHTFTAEPTPSTYEALLTCIALHPALYDMRQRTLAEWHSLREETLKYFLWQLHLLEAPVLGSRKYPIKNHVEVFKQIVHCSPKLRQLLRDVWDVTEKEKSVVVFTRFPCAANLIHKCIGWVGTSTVLVTHENTPEERLELIQNKFAKATKPTVLVVPFTMDLAAFDVSGSCATVIFVDQPTNSETFDQAVGVIRRPGQDAPQLCRTYVLDGR